MRAQPSSGLRDGEVRLATRAIKRGPPCLRLFAEHGVEGRQAEGRHAADIYDSFADMFTVLPVRVTHPTSRNFRGSVISATLHACPSGVLQRYSRYRSRHCGCCALHM